MSKKIPDGQKITENGKYEMSMDWYHSQCCDGVSVSSTGLRKIYNESPADFWAFSDLNDQRFEKEGTDYFTFGRAAHALLLGDEDFDANFIVKPRSAPAEPTSAQVIARANGRVSDAAKERFDFWDTFTQVAEGREILTAADMTHIEHIADMLNDHPLAPLLMEGEREQSLIWRDEKTGIWLKSRIDILPATGDLADLKSTVQVNKNLLMRDVRTKGYDMQMALGTIGMEEVMGIPFTPEEYEGRGALLLFVYKRPPYHIMPVEVTFDALAAARCKLRAAVNIMADCIENDYWPGPIEGIPTYDGTYEAAEIEEKQAANLLPTRW